MVSKTKNQPNSCQAFKNSCHSFETSIHVRELFSLPVSFGQERLLLATKFSHGMGELKSGKPNLK